MAEFQQQVQEVVNELVQAQEGSATKLLEVLGNIYTKTQYLEKRVEKIQKLRQDQFRHLVQILNDFDESKGGLYGFLSGLKEVLDHCSFESTLDQKIFIWSAALKARSDKHYVVFETERQLIQQKSFQTRCDELEIECSKDLKGQVEETIQWLDETLAKSRLDLQKTLRNCFRPEFLQLLQGLDTQELEKEIVEAYSQPLGLEQISGIRWYGLEAYARLQNMFQQAQALVDEKHVVEGTLVSAEQILKIFDETLVKPLKLLKPYALPKVEVQLNQSFKDAFQSLVSKKTVQGAEDR
jgi:hypothetical protein